MGTRNHQSETWRLDRSTGLALKVEEAEAFGQVARAPQCATLRIRGFWAFSSGCLEPKVWIRGLLRKGLGLCHGIPGNGFALLKLHPTGGAILRKNCFQNFSGIFGWFQGKCGWIVRCISQSLQWSAALKRRHFLVVQDRLNKPRLWMFGLQHYYAISRITKVQTTTSSVVLLQAYHFVTMILCELQAQRRTSSRSWPTLFSVWGCFLFTSAPKTMKVTRILGTS